MRTYDFEYQSVGIHDIAMMAVGKTLADMPIADNIVGLFAQWVLAKESWRYDEQLEHMEIATIDVMPESPDGFYFSVEGRWFIESAEEREADNKNDQAWIDARNKE